MTTEVLVVGGGPAGASAALWARSLGLDVALLEAERSLGGQLRLAHFEPSNLLLAEGEGPELADRLAVQLAESGIPVQVGEPCAGLERPMPGFDRAAVHTAAGVRLEAGAVVIATGVRRRRLAIPGEREFEGRGVSQSASQDRERFAGDDVIVVGGGDGAFESALLLAEVGCRVNLVLRAPARARAEFRERVRGAPRIEVLEGTRLAAIEGDERVRGVRLESDLGSWQLPAAAVIIKIGVQPSTEWCRATLDHDSEGYLKVDAAYRTSHPRAWAVGDVVRPLLFGVAVAAGQGALAVGSIHRLLRP